MPIDVRRVDPCPIMEEGASLQIRAVELEIKGVGVLRNIILK